jgi:hypothetical protein
MGLSATPGSIVIKDRSGVVKMDLSTKRPVVLQRIQGSFSSSSKVFVEKYPNSAFEPAVETGSFFYNTTINSAPGVVGAYSKSLKSIATKLISSGLSPDFLLVKARIVTNRDSRQVSAAGSCIASLGLPSMGLKVGQGSVYGPLNEVTSYDALDDAVTCIFHTYIQSGNVYMQIEIAPNYIKTGTLTAPTFVNHANWLRYEGTPSGGYPQYTYHYNVRIEYDISLMKFMGE